MYLAMMTMVGVAIFFLLSLLFVFSGEFEKATPLAIYAILAWLMIPEKQGPI